MHFCSSSPSFTASNMSGEAETALTVRVQLNIAAGSYLSRCQTAKTKGTWRSWETWLMLQTPVAEGRTGKLANEPMLSCQVILTLCTVMVANCHSLRTSPADEPQSCITTSLVETRT